MKTEKKKKKERDKGKNQKQQKGMRSENYFSPVIFPQFLNSGASRPIVEADARITAVIQRLREKLVMLTEGEFMVEFEYDEIFKLIRCLTDAQDWMIVGRVRSLETADVIITPTPTHFTGLNDEDINVIRNRIKPNADNWYNYDFKDCTTPYEHFMRRVAAAVDFFELITVNKMGAYYNVVAGNYSTDSTNKKVSKKSKQIALPKHQLRADLRTLEDARDWLRCGFWGIEEL